MLDLRRQQIEAGARPVGWKLGFGAPAAMEKLGIERPLVGFLTDRTQLPDGGTAHVGGWTRPMLEAEVAVRVGADGAIDGYAAAIELADLNPPPEDAEAIVAGNVFHRHFLVGPFHAAGDDLSATLRRDGEEVDRTDEPSALTGAYAELVETVRATAGDELRAGDVIITGSIFAPIQVAPGEVVTVEVAPLGALTVHIAE